MLDAFYAELRRCRTHCDGTRHIDHHSDQPHTCDRRCKPHECTGLAPSTIRRIHFLLSGAFKRAVRWEWIAVNPCAAAEPPPEPKPEPQPPTPEQAAHILNVAWEDPDWGAFVWLAMTTGARRAELCALRWRHIDLVQGTVQVSRSVDQDGARTTEKETKTHQQRRIALDPETVAVLCDHHDRWTERTRSLGIELPESAFVFSLSPDGSTPLKPDTVTQRYGRLADRLKIPTTFHKLRHFSATELITAGVDPRTVSGRLGHAGGGSTTLRVYSAWISESGQKAATSLATRMPARPSLDRVERAKTYPEAPYEEIAAEIRRQILDGELKPGDPAPTQRRIRETHHVSAGTANRVSELLKVWGLIDTSRGRHAVIRQSPNDMKETAPGSPEDATAADTGPRLLDLNLVHLGDMVRTFTSEADPRDPAQLQRLLTNAARRHGGKKADLANYELEVREAGASELLTTFAAL